MIKTQLSSNARWLVAKVLHPRKPRLRPVLFFMYSVEDIIADPKAIENAFRLDDEFVVSAHEETI